MTRSMLRTEATIAASNGTGPIVWIVRGLYALMVLHLVVPMIMFFARDSIAAGMREANPALSPEAVGYGLAATLIAGLIFHLVFVALYGWLVGRVRRGRRWARIVLTVVLIVATLASVVSFTLSPLFRLLIPATDLLQLVLIGLLWLPQAARARFITPVG